MKIIALEKESGIIGFITDQDLLKRESAHVYKLYLSGYIREIYFNEHKQAIIILECANLDEANNILDSLPLVENGFIRFNLYQLLPYSGFNRIIIPENETLI